LVLRDINILKYWASKEYEFPAIARMVREHLSILATSAVLESAFSVDGDIITKKRDILGGENSKRLL